MAINPLTRRNRIGGAAPRSRVVPGAGDPGNGSLTSASTSYPKGFIQNVRQLPQPRGWALLTMCSATAKTAIRGGVSVQNQLLRYEPQAAGAPISYTPVYYFGNLNSYLNLSGFLSPGTVTGHQKDRPTPRIYNISLGVQHDIGFNTILDVKYVSTLARNLGTTRAINTIPYGARFNEPGYHPTGSPALNETISGRIPAGPVSPTVKAEAAPTTTRCKWPPTGGSREDCSSAWRTPIRRRWITAERCRFTERARVELR